MGLNECGLSELRAMLARGDVSPSDIARDVVTAVETRESKVHAYLDFYKHELLSRAEALTKSGAYQSQPLGGLPIAVKDNIVIKDKRATAGSRILEHYRSPYTATAVRRLEGSGAIICGKTNLDEFAMGSSNENSAFTPTHNPWHLDHAPGGSSGGSAAAVAADLAIAALGSDTGGSIRQPASFCGIVGMKPTYGRVSRYGLIAFASSLDQIGPLTKSVGDCALILNSICGADRNDATSLSQPVPDLTSHLKKGLAGLTVGVPWDFLGEGMDSAVEANCRELMAELEGAGAVVVDVSLPHARLACACYYIIANAEASSNLARYDGVKYGHRTKQDDTLYEMYTNTREEGFGDEVKRRILLGTYVLSTGYWDAYYRKAQQVRSLIIDDFNKAFGACELIVMPTAPTPAFKLGEKTADPLQMYLSDVFTIPVNLAGLPAVSIPTGLSSDGLPIGMQFIGRPLDERTVLRAAHGAERLIGFERTIRV